MIKPSRSHQDYINFVKKRTPHISFPARHLNVLSKLRLLDLTPAVPILATLYSTTLGRPPTPPEDLLRSLIAMMLCGITSITEWVKMMRDQAFYAIISGFDPEHVPGIGTFYDFIDRLLGLDARKVKHLLKPKHRRKQARKEKKANKDKNKDTHKHEDIVAKLAARFLRQAENHPAPSTGWHFEPNKFTRTEQVIKAIFYACVISKSIELGLINLNDLFVSGDGSKLRTWANPHGRPRCNCKKSGKKDCDCPRYYHDPLARWGYDSYHKCWVYGHAYYELTSYSFDHQFQLPLVITMAGNNRHDSVLSTFAMHEAVDILGFPIKVASFDAASDAMGIYQLGHELWHTNLIIPLNKHNEGNYTYTPPLKINTAGTPICQNELPFYYWGYCPDRRRLKWRCPLKANKKAAREFTCPHQNTCSNSNYGRVVYTYPKDNYRLFTPIPRGSELWQKHYNQHPCVERSHKRKKYDFLLNQTRTAGRERWFFRVMLAAICQHIDAWYTFLKQQGKLQEATEAT